MKIATKAQRNHAWVQHGGGMLGAATTRPVVPASAARVPAPSAKVGFFDRLKALLEKWL